MREGECPPHRITMATPVRPATASCPACFHVLLAWRLLTSQTPLSTITYKTSSFFFHFFFSLSSSSLLKRKKNPFIPVKCDSDLVPYDNRFERNEGYTLDLISIEFTIFFLARLYVYIFRYARICKYRIFGSDCTRYRCVRILIYLYLDRSIQFSLHRRFYPVLGKRSLSSTGQMCIKESVTSRWEDGEEQSIKLERSNVRKGR